MSLDKLKIPGLLVHELFKNQLVDIRKDGENDPAFIDEIKDVLIILSEPKPGPVSAVSSAIIGKILAACKWRMEDTGFINVNGVPVTWTGIKNAGTPRICILFGPDSTVIDLPVIFPEFRIQQFDGTQFLQCPSPGTIENDRLLKSKLWLCMKELFNV